MTVLEMQSGCRIGGEYLLSVEKHLTIRVTVRDLREVWGAPQAQVEPVAGSGLIWVMVGRLLPSLTMPDAAELDRLDAMLSEILP